MTEESRDAQAAGKPAAGKTAEDKKQPETVLLTAEELRAIAGGASVVQSQPPTLSKGITPSQ